MKSIKSHELIEGDIFAKKLVLHGRESFIVINKPEGKNYIIIQKRGEKETKRFTIKENDNIILLKRNN
jgi:hypothetical protein